MKLFFHAFTIIEVIVVTGVFSILIGIGLPITLDFIRNYSLRNERDSLVTLLEYARNQSLTNVDQTNHGLQISNNQFTNFSGPSYSQRNPALDLIYPKSSTITITGPTEAVFTPLIGTSSASNFTVSNGFKQFSVTVNPEGTIDW